MTEHPTDHATAGGNPDPSSVRWHRLDCALPMVVFWPGRFEEMASCLTCRAHIARARLEPIAAAPKPEPELAEKVKPKRHRIGTIPPCPKIRRRGDAWPTHRAKSRRRSR